MSKMLDVTKFDISLGCVNCGRPGCDSDPNQCADCPISKVNYRSDISKCADRLNAYRSEHLTPVLQAKETDTLLRLKRQLTGVMHRMFTSSPEGYNGDIHIIEQAIMHIEECAKRRM